MRPPGTAAHQASLSFTISRSFLRLMSTESVMPSSHHPKRLLLPLLACDPFGIPFYTWYEIGTQVDSFWGRVCVFRKTALSPLSSSAHLLPATHVSSSGLCLVPLLCLSVSRTGATLS